MKKRIIILSLIILLIYPVIVLADDIEEEYHEGEIEEIIQTSAVPVNEPKINSRIAIVLDRNSDTILYEKNSNQKTPMASTTKIMTAIIALENADLTEVVEVSKKAAMTGGSRLGLQTGDKITIKDLLYGLLLKSRK